jgi:hypothetical protein
MSRARPLLMSKSSGPPPPLMRDSTFRLADLLYGRSLCVFGPRNPLRLMLLKVSQGQPLFGVQQQGWLLGVGYLQHILCPCLVISHVLP